LQPPTANHGQTLASYEVAQPVAWIAGVGIKPKIRDQLTLDHERRILQALVNDFQRVTHWDTVS
jgi:hypothetical protein